MAFSLRTKTPRLAIDSAPRARLRLRIAGKNSGLKPTANAIGNSKVSTGGLPRSMCATKTEKHHDQHRRRH